MSIWASVGRVPSGPRLHDIPDRDEHTLEPRGARRWNLDVAYSWTPTTRLSLWADDVDAQVLLTRAEVEQLIAQLQYALTMIEETPSEMRRPS